MRQMRFIVSRRRSGGTVQTYSPERSVSLSSVTRRSGKLTVRVDDAFFVAFYGCRFDCFLTFSCYALQ